MKKILGSSQPLFAQTGFWGWPNSGDVLAATFLGLSCGRVPHHHR